MKQQAKMWALCGLLLSACGGDDSATPNPEPTASQGTDAAVRSVDAAMSRVDAASPGTSLEPDYASVPALPKLSWSTLRQTACTAAGGSCVGNGECAKSGGALIGAIDCPSVNKLVGECCRVAEPCSGPTGGACCVMAVSLQTGVGGVGTDRTTFCQRGHLSCVGKRELVGFSPSGDCRNTDVTDLDEEQPSLWPNAVGVEEAARKACEAAGAKLGGTDKVGCDPASEQPVIVASRIPCCIERGACKPANPDTECCSSSGTRGGKQCVDGQQVCTSLDTEVPKGTCGKK